MKLFCLHPSLFYIGKFHLHSWNLGIHKTYKHSTKEYICPNCYKQVNHNYLDPKLF